MLINGVETIQGASRWDDEIVQTTTSEQVMLKKVRVKTEVVRKLLVSVRI